MLVARLASADGPVELSPEVQVLFKDARTLMREGDYQHASERLEQARRMSDGSGIKYNLAVCDEMLGKTATAWLLYLDVAEAERQSGDSGREQIARSRAERISARVPHLRIAVTTSTTNLVVMRDALTLQPRDLGAPTAVDPGHHTIRANAPGHAEWSREIDLKEGETAEVVVPDFDPPQVVASVPVSITPTLTTIPAEPTRNPWRTFALGTGIVGSVALAAGGAFFVADVATYSAGGAYCTPQNSCGPRGVSLRNDALTYGDAATVLVVTGAVALAAAVVVWFVQPKRRDTAMLLPTFEF